jgi:NAD(P)H dehydrogenase (quinone)
MRIAVVLAHPSPDSFAHAVAESATVALERGGHDVTVLDLHADGFGAAMSADERHAYHGEQPILDPIVARHAEVVTAADALVFVYPTWWSTMPAILKGWLERVMVPGVGFVFDARQHVRPGLTRIRHLVGISTYGASWPLVKLVNDNGRRTLLRALRLNTGWRTRRTWLGLYRIDSRAPEERVAFLERVATEMSRL